jgi:hypothetical protein
MRRSNAVERTIIWCRDIHGHHHAFQASVWKGLAQGQGHALCSHITLGCVELWKIPDHWGKVKHCKDCIWVIRTALSGIPLGELADV